MDEKKDKKKEETEKMKENYEKNKRKDGMKATVTKFDDDEMEECMDILIKEFLLGEREDIQIDGCFIIEDGERTHIIDWLAK